MVSTASRLEKPRIGIFGIGLAAYWSQFASLQERLTGYLHLIEERLGQWGDVVSGGLVDTYEAARGAGNMLASAQVDVLFIYVATYATSSIVLPVVQATKAPVVVLNLQPIAALDYEAMTTEEWLANCSACCVPEIGGALTRARIDYKVISGALLEDERGVARQAQHVRCAAHGLASWGIPILACWVCIPTSPPSQANWAATLRCWRSTI
jgi:L-arabinose isomerase